MAPVTLPSSWRSMPGRSASTKAQKVKQMVAAHEVVITINAFMGGAQVIVGPTTRVQMEGTGIMGGYSEPSGLVEADLDESSPVVRITGVAIWGGVSVERKHL